MALPFERMTVQPGDALCGIGLEGVRAATLQQGIAVGIGAEKRQMEDMRRFVEVQRRTGVQLVVQGGALGVHAGQTVLLWLSAVSLLGLEPTGTSHVQLRRASTGLMIRPCKPLSQPGSENFC
ncbi:protein of unknown function [Pseudomonas sp. JV241A]|nr:protein of unknown function [Pseudomonas sp. JV241A]